MKNPLKLYLNYLRKKLEPKSATHYMTMNLEIPKGKTEGRALVPCAMYTLSHAIDLNPALIRKTDKKIIKKFPVNKRISFDSNKYDVKLTEEEKLANYKLEEVERCPKCGLKTVIAEVSETRYRSCPDIRVKVSDKAKENLVIPVKFGIRQADIKKSFIMMIVLDLLTLYFILSFIFPQINILNTSINKIVSFNKFFGYIGLSLIGLFYLHCFVLYHYSVYRTVSWYNKFKHTLIKM